MRRRDFLKLVSTGAAITVSMIPLAATATPESALKAIERIIGSKAPKDGKIKINMVDIAENGSTVPLTVMVDSPMTPDDHVKALHLFNDGNPLSDVASYHLGPHNGKAQISLRMRLIKTQNVIAVAEMSDGETYIIRRRIKVTIGGCGG
ncbi:MAG: thiosulfate oxidation carrier protein SoxY [Rhodospirillaceae bacterium]|nr:thiosulfate oxidation carrier protein SoxY [Rhodospirillaceae bacterium]